MLQSKNCYTGFMFLFDNETLNSEFIFKRLFIHIKLFVTAVIFMKCTGAPCKKSFSYSVRNSNNYYLYLIGRV